MATSTLVLAPVAHPKRRGAWRALAAKALRVGELEAVSADSLDVALERARLVAEIGVLTRELELAPPESGRDLDASEAAQRLNALDSDGKPSDRFYNRIAPKIGRKDGSKWSFARERVEAYRRGEIQ